LRLSKYGRLLVPLSVTLVLAQVPAQPMGQYKNLILETQFQTKVHGSLSTKSGSNFVFSRRVVVNGDIRHGKRAKTG
jgi:hypothetical protein